MSKRTTWRFRLALFLLAVLLAGGTMLLLFPGRFQLDAHLLRGTRWALADAETGAVQDPLSPTKLRFAWFGNQFSGDVGDCGNTYAGEYQPAGRYIAMDSLITTLLGCLEDQTGDGAEYLSALSEAYLVALSPTELRLYYDHDQYLSFRPAR